MRILHAIASANPAGGGPIEGVKQLGAVLTRSGHSVEVASLDAADAPYVRNFPLPVHALGPGILRYGFTPRWVPWMRANAAGYDAVIVNGVWQYHSFGTWMALRNSSTPYVLFTHGMLDPWFKVHYPLKHVKKWLYWPWAEYRVLRDAAAVLFTSEEERLLARRSFWLYQGNERVVNYGTSAPRGDALAQRAAFLARFPQLEGKRLALHFGRIHHKKGCDLLIEAFAQTLARDPDWELVLAGPDQIGWQAKLQRRAARLGIAERITWTGVLRGELKWGAFRAAEVFVLPSHTENFGIAVAEALACGLPVLISDKVNTWREVAAHEAGLVAPDTLAGTVDLFRRWLALGEEPRERLRQNASSCFRDRFEVHRAAATLVEVLADVQHRRPEYAPCRC